MLSQKAKYAIRAMLYLGRHGRETPVLIRDIAASGSLPRKFLEAILVDLKGSGMLRSRPGKGGGYMLNRDPKSIPLGTIIRLMDGPLAPIACVSQTAYAPCRDCPDEANCVIRAAMKEVRDATARVLDATTLGDLLNREDELRQSSGFVDFHI